MMFDGRPCDLDDAEYEERLRRCAELGQVVPINKPRLREHYEQLCAQQLAETPQ